MLATWGAEVVTLSFRSGLCWSLLWSPCPVSITSFSHCAVYLSPRVPSGTYPSSDAMALIASSMVFSFSHIFLFSVLILFILYTLRSSLGDQLSVPNYPTGTASHYPSEETLRSRSLTEKQCRAAFPGLLKEVDDAVARGKFVQDRFDPENSLGPVRGRIKDGKVGLSVHSHFHHTLDKKAQLTTRQFSYTSSSPSAKMICPKTPFA